MNENVKNLLQLISENPDLPIVCMVESEIVGDGGYGRWLADFGACYIGEYACYGEQFFDDRDEFKEIYYDRNDEILNERFGYDPIKTLPDAQKRFTAEEIEKNKAANEALEKYLDEVADRAFIRAIVVNVDTPIEAIKEVEDE